MMRFSINEKYLLDFEKIINDKVNDLVEQRKEELKEEIKQEYENKIDEIVARVNKEILIRTPMYGKPTTK